MPKFAANLTTLFTEMPIADRFHAAAEAGFRGVEILYPYDIKASLLRKWAKAAGVEIVLINCPPANWSGGDRGFAAVPGLEERFRRDFDRVLDYAYKLHAVHINLLAGVTFSHHDEARNTFLANLSWATERAPHTSLVLEPANQNEEPGSYLSSFDFAAEIIAEIGAPNLGLQFDICHAQVITGDVIGTWEKHAPQIRHIQIAGCPGRGEPDQEKFDFRAFFDVLDRFGYRGWVSAEYTPQSITESSLSWMPGR